MSAIYQRAKYDAKLPLMAVIKIDDIDWISVLPTSQERADQINAIADKIVKQADEMTEFA